MHIDVTAVRLHKPAGDRQAKAGAALLSGNAVVDLLKLVEDARLVAGCPWSPCRAPSGGSSAR